MTDGAKTRARGKHFTELTWFEQEECAALVQSLMRAGSVDWSGVGALYGLSWEAVRRRFDPRWANRRREQINRARSKMFANRAPKTVRRIDAEARHRLAEIPDDTRSITGRLMGDPLPGRSALDRANDNVEFGEVRFDG